MKIFITGAGLVGSFVAKKLFDSSQEVILFDQKLSKRYIKSVLGTSRPTFETGDIRNLNHLTHLFHKYRPDCIVHTAAALRGVIEEKPILGISINTIGVASVLLAAANAGIPKIVLCSSLSVYDYSLQKEPIIEEHPLRPNSVYDATKLAGEYIAMSLARKNNMDLIILRFASIYGYGVFRGGAWLGKQLQSIFFDLLSNKKIILKEKEFGANEYVYVKDVAQAIQNSCLRDVSGINIFNIGSGEILSTMQLANILAVVSGSKKIKYEAMSKGTFIPDFINRKYPFDIKKAKKILEYTPKFTFKEGMQDYKNYLLPMVNKTFRF